MKKRLLTTLLILTLMLTSLGGAALAEDKVLIVGQAEDTTTLDPQMQGDMPAMSILINIYDTLITRDEGGNLIPCLATEWEALDETTWQFKLREGVTFHNGEPFNAESVKATLERLIDPATGSPIEEQENLTGIEVVDEYTINLTFSGSDPLVPAKLVMFGGVMLPAEYTKTHDAEYLAQNPVGTGPYKFVSWTKDYEVVLEKNEDYWLGAPAYDKLIFRAIPDEAAMLTAIQVGEVDVVSSLTSDMVVGLSGNEDVKVVNSPWIRTSYIALDCTESPLNIKEVRQAMNWAVDKETIIETLFGGAAHQVSTIMPHQNFGYDEEVPMYGYDPEKAKSLLEAAGYADGFTVRLECGNSDAMYAQAIGAYLEQVGIHCEINPVDPNTLVSDTSGGTADALVYQSNTGWTMDAWNNFYSYLRSNRKYNQGYDYEGLDALIDIEEKDLDMQRRLEAISEIQNILSEECYFIYLWQRDCIYAIRSDVEYTPNTLNLLKMYNARPAE
ncbi:MAG: ABC transporter substrate-binding protein [Clostridiales bacterium]|nr:ABC transporter substrate-binding protein [Clostridiales bacterium]